MQIPVRPSGGQPGAGKRAQDWVPSTTCPSPWPVAASGLIRPWTAFCCGRAFADGSLRTVRGALPPALMARPRALPAWCSRRSNAGEVACVDGCPLSGQKSGSGRGPPDRIAKLSACPRFPYQTLARKQRCAIPALCARPIRASSRGDRGGGATTADGRSARLG